MWSVRVQVVRLPSIIILPAPRATVVPVPNRGVLPGLSAQMAVLSNPYRLGSVPNTLMWKVAVIPNFRLGYRFFSLLQVPPIRRYTVAEGLWRC
jgi:hypothetical protein